MPSASCCSARRSAPRASGSRSTLKSLVRGYGLELSEALSRYVLGGIMSRNEARRTLGYPGRSDGDELWQPVNVETVHQAQSRQDRADATAEANIAAANSNEQIAASDRGVEARARAQGAGA